MRINYTKIVATLGPSSDSFSVIEDLVLGGMDVARLNFSHGTYKNFKQIVGNVRKAAKKHNRTVGIIQDLQGPKIRLGTLPPEGIPIKNGKKLTLTTATAPKKGIIPVQYKSLHKEVKKGHRIFVDDGLIRLKVTRVNGSNIHCKIETTGILHSNKGINAPDSKIKAKTLTAKDRKDLNFGISLGVDYIALSFVKSAKDIRDLRTIIAKKSHKPKIIAKIERHEACNEMEKIVEEADGIMVARGDLGIEIKPEKVPIVQKALIRLSNRHAKPVITATQVLASMVENSRPTRAEISDAANAVFDNTDAIMLSNETAIGKYSVKSVRTLAKVISEVENEQKKHEEVLQNKIQNRNIPELNATCLSACELAVESNANKIIIYSTDGYTIHQIAKHRVHTPTITVTPNKQLIQELSLLWGINQSLYKKFTQHELQGNFTGKLVKFLLKNKKVKKGERIVIVYNAKDKGSVASLKV
jgi:pyruvate kinase